MGQEAHEPPGLVQLVEGECRRIERINHHETVEMVRVPPDESSNVGCWLWPCPRESIDPVTDGPHGPHSRWDAGGIHTDNEVGVEGPLGPREARAAEARGVMPSRDGQPARMTAGADTPREWPIEFSSSTKSSLLESGNATICRAISSLAERVCPSAPSVRPRRQLPGMLLTVSGRACEIARAMKTRRLARFVFGSRPALWTSANPIGTLSNRSCFSESTSLKRQATGQRAAQVGVRSRWPS